MNTEQKQIIWKIGKKMKFWKYLIVCVSLIVVKHVQCFKIGRHGKGRDIIVLKTNSVFIYFYPATYCNYCICDGNFSLKIVMVLR